MNDNELDEILGQWKTPAVRKAWSTDLRDALNALEHGRGFFRWLPRLMPVAGKGLLATAGAGVFLVAVAAAFPQSSAWFSTPPPYTVDAENIRYTDNGTPRIEEYFTATADYSGRKSEIVLSATYPDDLHRTIHALFMQLFDRIPWLPDDNSATIAKARFTAYLKSNCAAPERFTIGNETVLDHRTTVSQNIATESPDGKTGKVWRLTYWRAPDLGCFTLKNTTEVRQPDGTFLLTQERRPLKVTTSRRQ